MSEVVYCPFCKTNRRLGPKRGCKVCRARLVHTQWQVPASWMTKPISALPISTAPPEAP